MKILYRPEKNTWAAWQKRPSTGDDQIARAVKKILKKVQRDGDKALYQLAEKYDGVKLRSLEPDAGEWSDAETQVSQELKQALAVAKKNLESFHRQQVLEPVPVETMPGIRCWRKSVGLDRVGLYIPGGTAPLFSTVLMLGIPAQLAGCGERILCTPPGRDGRVPPAILYAARLCGIGKVFKAGGAQAIAALAYGTESIPPVNKIFGPGNRFVTYAKQRIMQEGVAIDMPAGPSELLVIADDSANPDFVAADLLSQAEHGADSQVILLTPSEQMAHAVHQSVKRQAEVLPRAAVALEALQHSRILVLNSLLEALDFSNAYAPEHLILHCRDAAIFADNVRNAGSVFLGPYTPETAGDYASGTNHTLPTNGFARAWSGVSVDSFVKKITFQELSRGGLEQIGNTLMTMAAAEGLEAHRRAVSIRLDYEHAI